MFGPTLQDSFPHLSPDFFCEGFLVSSAGFHDPILYGFFIPPRRFFNKIANKLGTYVFAHPQCHVKHGDGSRGHSSHKRENKLLYFEWAPPWHVKTATLTPPSLCICQVGVVMRFYASLISSSSQLFAKMLETGNILHSVWHSLHISWHSVWHSLHISWHSVWHSFWHIFWQS